MGAMPVRASCSRGGDSGPAATSFAAVLARLDSAGSELGNYGRTLSSTVRKLRDRCDPSGSGDFVSVVNDFERSFACLERASRTPSTLKANVSHLVGVFRRYVPELSARVSPKARQFWGSQIVALDRRLREDHPENDVGEDPSWESLTWADVVRAKRKLRLGSFERLAVDVYTTEGVPPRRGEWAHVTVYAEEDPASRPPDKNWMYLPPRGSRGAFVEFNAFKTRKSMSAQRVELPEPLVSSVRAAMHAHPLPFPRNLFGFDNFNHQTQSNKFGSLLMRALNSALDRADIRRPANMFRHLFLTDLLHNRLERTTDEELRDTLRKMGTSLEQAVYTYRIVAPRVGGSTGADAGAALIGAGTRLRLLSLLLADLGPRG